MKAKMQTLCLAILASTAVFGEKSRTSGETKTITLPGGATMEMVWCGPGTFEMGSPADEAGRFENEKRHSVTITKGFWIGKYEVTQRQWESVMHSNFARFKSPDGPVENVSWNDCETFIRRVNFSLGGVVRFPTEAEWEYACRAGSDTPFSGGATISDVAWYDFNSDSRTHDAGRKQPNAWGIYDMHGNVLEWCDDWFSAAPGDPVDPKGPPSGAFKVLRGGCWFFYERDCRCAYRLKREPNTRNCIFGFRVVCSDDEPQPPAR
jgi:formylglycine-generating enzyme required for sulfatase activity